ncbi:MAG: TetR/AcrR family transcriptional regulator [Burkholderiaceae bacterium]|nr:TetR/AcrR family transcriptional regulator [Burkholderiaceae bacterium]
MPRGTAAPRFETRAPVGSREPVDARGPVGSRAPAGSRVPARGRGRAPRSDNRLPLVRDAAAKLIRHNGYLATTMREIAAMAGMLPGSLYYHFSSKDELLVAVYAEGVRRISAPVACALALERDPWSRLEAVCAAHLDALLGGNDYAQVGPPPRRGGRGPTTPRWGGGGSPPPPRHEPRSVWSRCAMPTRSCSPLRWSDCR